MLYKVNLLLEEEIEKGHFSGAVWLVYKKGEVIARGSVGYSSITPVKRNMTDRTIFDLASLTKPMVTAPLVLKFLKRKYINLDTPLVDMNVMPFAGKMGEVNILQLLTHTSGLKSWYPCYARKEQMLRGMAIIGSGGHILYEKVPKMIDQYAALISTLKMEAKPGEKVIYSCLGYIMLSYILQVKCKIKYKEEAIKHILTPLKLTRTFFHVPKSLLTQTAAGEDSNTYERMKSREFGLNFSNWRDGIIHGTVNDGNAYYADSETGNAGLFADIDDTLKLCLAFLPGSELFSEEELRLLYDDITEHQGDHRSVAWNLARSQNDPANGILPDETIGHTGFTGCAVWINPVDREIYILFLNRLHPKRVEFPIEGLRSNWLHLAKAL